MDSNAVSYTHLDVYKRQVPIGAVNRFPVTLPGLVSVTNEEAASGGFDEETDDELRERYFEKVSLPATSGSKYHYVMWAKEVSGVGDAKCLPLWNGNGTVKVVIINADKGAASSELISAVKPVSYTQLQAQVDEISKYGDALELVTTIEGDATVVGASQLATFQLQGDTIKTCLLYTSRCV